MSDIVKIVVFSLFLSILWVIPRFDLMIQWMTNHIWYSSAIGISFISLFLCFNWMMHKRANRHLVKQSLNVEKSEG